MISSECDTRITLIAQAKGIGAAGNENYNFFMFLLLLINYILFLAHALCVSPLCSGNLSLEVSALRQWLQSGFQSVHTNHFIAACSVQISGDPFRLHYSYLRFGFYRFYTVGALVRHIHVCISIT